LDLVRYLVETYPESVYSVDNQGNLALHVALLGVPAEYQVVKLLLEANPQAAHHVNEFGMLPLHAALRNTPVPFDVFEMILQANAEAVYRVSNSGKSALHYALQDVPACLQIVQKLVQLNPGQLDMAPDDNLLVADENLKVAACGDQVLRADEFGSSGQVDGLSEKMVEDRGRMNPLQLAVTDTPASLEVVEFLVKASDRPLAYYLEQRKM
jgi:ankyrin repeat protein